DMLTLARTSGYCPALGLCTRGALTALAQTPSPGPLRSAGYGDSVPLIVYWNLRISPARGRFPVSAEQRGVVTLAGFSQGLLKSFLEHRIETVDPASQMRAMLDSEYFDSVQVAPEDAERQVEPSFASLLCESAST
ncbi:unnamed protein product, partial [Effrenium voratum]